MQRNDLLAAGVMAAVLALAGPAMAECIVEAEYDEEEATANVKVNAADGWCVDLDTDEVPPMADLRDC